MAGIKLKYNCEVCGKEFEASKHWAKYCCKRCRTIGWARIEVKRDEEARKK